MTSPAVTQRIALEVAVVRSMLHNLRAAGFAPSSVFDGEDHVKVSLTASPAEAADRVLTVALNLDECRVYFKTPTGDRVGNVYLVFGNDGWDVICDWSWNDDTESGRAFNEALDKFNSENAVVSINITKRYAYRPLSGAVAKVPYEIHYSALNGRTIQRVIFERHNSDAALTERVSIHWGDAFKWADADPCGGLGLVAVQLSDGTEVFATGRYFNADHPRSQGQHGLSAVHVGCYGSSWMDRVFKPHDPAVGVGYVKELP